MAVDKQLYNAIKAHYLAPSKDTKYQGRPIPYEFRAAAAATAMGDHIPWQLRQGSPASAGTLIKQKMKEVGTDLGDAASLDVFRAWDAVMWDFVVVVQADAID